jgi:ubiquinone/menaquinone biosynthesis C-methylase UbiE
MSEYRTLFDARGARYNRANRLFPEARAEEADRLLERLRIPERARWLDVGAGGGFLAARARAANLLGPAVGCDESVVFLSEAPAYALRTACAFERLPYRDQAFAAAASLAALHHAESPERVLAEMLRVTARGSSIAVGDVAGGSRAASFLNGFVDRHTAAGHAGRFYAPERLRALLESARGREARAEEIEVAWRFARREDAVAFCRELFGLEPETENAQTESALDGLGLARHEGGWRLPWTMVFGSAARA